MWANDMADDPQQGTNAQLAALAALDDELRGEGIDYWLFGGWAVDFHAGAVTRRHDDLDVAVWAADADRIGRLLGDGGWAHRPADGGDGYTVYVRGAVRLEMAFLARDETGDAYTPLPDGRAEWPAGAFGDDVAELHGVRARVIGLAALRVEKSQQHADPLVAAKDRADTATLARLR